MYFDTEIYHISFLFSISLASFFLSLLSFPYCDTRIEVSIQRTKKSGSIKKVMDWLVKLKPEQTMLPTVVVVMTPCPLYGKTRYFLQEVLIPDGWSNKISF